MEKLVFAFITVVGLIAISGCVAAGNLAFEPETAVLSQSAAVELDARRKSYAKCLAVKATEEVINTGSYSREKIKIICASLALRYYEAVYSDVFPRDKSEKFSSSTAKSAVVQLEKITFDRLDDELRK